PDCRGAAATDARDADALGVHVGSADEVVDAADAVPALDARRRVAQGLPPPAALAVGAVVNAGDFAELQRIDDQATVAMVGEHETVVLERGLVAVAALAGVAADVKDRGQLLTGEITPPARLRPVQVGGDV